MGITTVISVRGRDRKELQATPGFVYVGRRCAGWPDSIWGNPFKPDGGDIAIVDFMVRTEWFNKHAVVDRSIGTVAACVDLYEQWVRASGYLMGRLPELRGKVLGCWCCDWPNMGSPPKPCHAVALARLADSLPA